MTRTRVRFVLMIALVAAVFVGSPTPAAATPPPVTIPAAQAAVYGWVTEYGTGLPIQGATVRLQWWENDQWNETPGTAQITNAQGYYTFSGSDFAEYRVLFSAPGYEPFTTWPFLYPSATTSMVDAELRTTLKVDRLADSTRFSTAVEIARAGYDDPNAPGTWPGVKHVILASGDDRAAADPLAAAGLCWAYDAPLLLVSASSTPSEVRRAVREIASANGAVTVHIVGGPVSVPDARFRDLDPGSGSLIKHRLLSSGDRYDMAAKIARTMREVGGPRPYVLVANGADPSKFFDALALSPISANIGAPIVLVSKDKVPAATRGVLDEFFDPFNPQYVVVVGGGPATISERVRGSIKGSVRWYGSDRYRTAIVIADNAIERHYLRDARVGLAAALPDALTGGSMVGSEYGPLLITAGDSLTPSTGSWIDAHANRIGRVHVFGGPRSVSERVKSQVEAKLK